MARKKSWTERKEEKDRKVAEVVDFFETRYGSDMSRLEAWQTLCGDINVGVGNTIGECQRNLKGNYFNIFDFKTGIEDNTGFRRFRSRQALSNYIRNNWMKMFPREPAKQNVILRWLLIQLC